MRRFASFVAVGAIGVLATACGGLSGLPDPFAGGRLPHAAVVSDTVDCLMGPDSCSRYIVLKPVGESEQQLLARVRSFMTEQIGWQLQRHPSPSVVRYGEVYDGPTDENGNNYGGYINAASDEYAAWQREHFTTGIHPPVKAELSAQRAMRTTPDGVFVELLGST